MIAARVLRDLGAGKGEIVVLNDEAHHCYQDKLLEHPDPRSGQRGPGAQPRPSGVVSRPAADPHEDRHQDRLRPVGHAVLPQGVRLQRGLHLPRTGSRPFPKPDTGKIAVKIINDYRDEVVKVFTV